MKTMMKIFALSCFIIIMVNLSSRAQDLYTALEEGDVALIRELVRKDHSTMDKRNSDLLTPLNLAASLGKTEAVATLLELGADPFKGDNENSQPIHLTEKDADMLQKRGFDISRKDNEGKTPLDFALFYGQKRIAYRMVAAGAGESSLAAYFHEECPLAKNYNNGEAQVWFLGHSGWAVKTRNHFMVFDYFDNPRSREPENACLTSGNISSETLAGQNTQVFSTHGDDKLMAEFTDEMDKVALMNKQIDLMFGPIRGCGLGTPEQVRAGT